MAGCGTSWNTFLTGGLCPSCACRWDITACHSCRQYSLHAEWYHYPDPVEEPQEQVSADETVEA
jgi:hypothetical protein